VTAFGCEPGKTGERDWVRDFFDCGRATLRYCKFQVVDLLKTPAFDTELGRLPSNPSTLHPTLTKESPCANRAGLLQALRRNGRQGWTRTKGWVAIARLSKIATASEGECALSFAVCISRETVKASGTHLAAVPGSWICGRRRLLMNWASPLPPVVPLLRAFEPRSLAWSLVGQSRGSARSPQTSSHHTKVVDSCALALPQAAIRIRG
jgi:hypothetical protein